MSKQGLNFLVKTVLWSALKVSHKQIKLSFMAITVILQHKMVQLKLARKAAGDT